MCVCVRARVGDGEKRWRGIYSQLMRGWTELEDPRRGWEDNIKMDLQETGSGSMDWIGLSEDRNKWRALVNTVMNLRVP